MLFAMSEIDLRTWQNLKEALACGLNSVRQGTAIAPHYSLHVDMAELTAGQDLDYLAGILSERPSNDSSVATGRFRRYAERLAETLSAESVDAEVATAVEDKTLFKLAGVLRQGRNKSEGVGYAGAVQTAEMRASPWELALRRAFGAAERSPASGDPRGVIVRGRRSEVRPTGVPVGTPADRKTAVGRVELMVRFDAAEEP